MQGNCVGVDKPLYIPPSSHAPLLPILPYQCLILVDGDLGRVWGVELWLDGLYFRLTTPREIAGEKDGFNFNNYLINLQGDTTELWMTNVTLQGNGDGVQDCDDCALSLHKGVAVYAEGAATAASDGHFYWVSGAILLVFLCRRREGQSYLQ